MWRTGEGDHYFKVLKNSDENDNDDSSDEDGDDNDYFSD
jgi:hypothetical protein